MAARLRKLLAYSSVSVRLPAAYIFQSTKSGAVAHPAGNVAEHLVASGLARIVDWHAGMLSTIPGAMERLRAAERAAKEKRAYLYASAPAMKASGSGATTPSGQKDLDGHVVRVWSGDQISIVESGPGGKERRVQLSSVRSPK
jgi:staphylococcal nuclease domain-containing protein 1